MTFQKNKTMEFGGRSEGERGREERIFEGSKNILHDNILMNICHYAFVQIHKCTTPRMTSNINMDFEQLRCVGVDSLIVTNVPLMWGIFIVGKLLMC